MANGAAAAERAARTTFGSMISPETQSNRRPPPPLHPTPTRDFWRDSWPVPRLGKVETPCTTPFHSLRMRHFRDLWRLSST